MKNIMRACILSLLVFILASPSQAQLFGGSSNFDYPDTLSVTDIKIENNTISGTVKNTSDMPITDIELTVFFMDQNDQPLGKTEINPLSQDGGITLPGMESAEPLQPGETRQFSQEMSDLPEGWNPQDGKKDIKITALEFEVNTNGAQQQNGGQQPDETPMQEEGGMQDQSPIPGNQQIPDDGPIQ